MQGSSEFSDCMREFIPARRRVPPPLLVPDLLPLPEHELESLPEPDSDSDSDPIPEPEPEPEPIPEPEPGMWAKSRCIRQKNVLFNDYDPYSPSVFVKGVRKPKSIAPGRVVSLELPAIPDAEMYENPDIPEVDMTGIQEPAEPDPSPHHIYFKPTPNEYYLFQILKGYSGGIGHKELSGYLNKFEKNAGLDSQILSGYDLDGEEMDSAPQSPVVEDEPDDNMELYKDDLDSESDSSNDESDDQDESEGNSSDDDEFDQNGDPVGVNMTLPHGEL
uniref:Uncharacterized protein n=2 Tax=Moniliophthora roreri TaxID=221103 RepID=A0A0W0G316_MONRR